MAPAKRRFGALRVAVCVIIVAFVAFLAIDQLASDALYASAAGPVSVVSRVPLRFGERVYAELDRLAPAAYVESTLARAALNRGDPDAAMRHALRLPASPVRDELLARVALARHEAALAFEYFLAAPDFAALQSIVDARAMRDPLSAYRLEQLVARRIELLGAHPDALAQSRWRLGLLANETAWKQVPGSAVQKSWLRAAQGHFSAAADAAPFSQRYAIAAANQADLLGDETSANAFFGRAASLDPGSADAIAGLGVVAYRRGDRAAANAYLRRARQIDPNARMVRALERDLR